MSHTGRTRWVLLRDLVIFQGKLLLDGAKDVVLSPLAVAAVVADLVLPGERPGRFFYGVMRIGERFDRWLSLFSAAEKADALDDGLFGSNRAGSPSFLGRLEEIVLGHAETDGGSGGERAGADAAGADATGAKAPGADGPGAGTRGGETPGAGTPGAEGRGAERSGARGPGAGAPAG